MALAEIEGWRVGNAWLDGYWGEGGLAFVDLAERHLREGTFRDWCKKLREPKEKKS